MPPRTERVSSFRRKLALFSWESSDEYIRRYRQQSHHDLPQSRLSSNATRTGGGAGKDHALSVLQLGVSGTGGDAAGYGAFGTVREPPVTAGRLRRRRGSIAMSPGAADRYRPTYWTNRARAIASRGEPLHSDSSAAREADAAAEDWQIVVHLKVLFQRDPALLSTLFEDARCTRPAHARTLMIAAAEALAANPDSVPLLYHIAKAALSIGKQTEAAELLERAVTLDPQHTDSIALLSQVRRSLREAQQSAWWAVRQPSGGKKQEASSMGTTEGHPERKGQGRT